MALLIIVAHALMVGRGGYSDVVHISELRLVVTFRWGIYDYRRHFRKLSRIIEGYIVTDASRTVEEVRVLSTPEGVH